MRLINKPEPREEAMDQRHKRAAKQHVQDKAILDHLTVGRRRPHQVPVDPRRASRFDEENGRELMEALKKRWTGAKSGGLPEF